MYSVKFQNKEFSGALQNIVEDGVLQEVSHRWFTDEHGERTEVPMPGTVFTFSAERHALLVKRAQEVAASKAETASKS